VEGHTFQKQTAVRWLSLGPVVRRVLEQWDCICSFVKERFLKDLGKDASTAPKRACYKIVAAMLSDEEKKRTKVQLEFISNVSPLFEDFLCFCQRSCPQVHILYDKMCEFLLKLMSEYREKSAYESLCGSKMQDVDCGRSNQLPDSEIVIGDPAKKTLLALLKPDHQKSVMLGIRTFFSISVDYLQSHLPLQNPLLRTFKIPDPSKENNGEQCLGH